MQKDCLPLTLQKVSIINKIWRFKFAIRRVKEVPFCVLIPFVDRVLLSAAVVQLDRAPGFEPGGREFESLQPHHSYL